MSEKRRDSKNRILRTGESQEADGRYKFRYIDGNGVSQPEKKIMHLYENRRKQSTEIWMI